RNPQWVGLFSVLLGLAISCGSWLLVLAVCVVGASYHIQIVEEEKLCLAKFGQPYDEYLQRVARYLLIM
ncbi:MAG: phospholipid methyltransferase, partial [Anaerolineales bacterium]